MGIVIDTTVWVLAEKVGGTLNLARWAHYEGAYMSAITASELLVSVEQAISPERRALRGAFVENLLAAVPVLDFSASVARAHARLVAALPKNVTVGAHGALIAATAIHHGYAVLTRNVADFRLFAGLTVEAFALPTARETA